MPQAHLVVAHYDEDLSWLDRIDRSVYEVVLVSKTRKDADIYCPVNKGHEASAFLEFMVHYYDRLHEFCVFVHGHDESWHHTGSMVDLVHSLPPFERTYKNINNRVPNTFVIKAQEIPFGPDTELEYGLKLWRGTSRHVFAPLEVEAFPHTFRARICAQFYAHRSCIHRHPREHYAMWLHRIYINTIMDDKQLACVFEWSWCFLMTGEYDEVDYEESDRSKHGIAPSKRTRTNNLELL